jgi:ribosomal protein S18 acetylase RimI-like enzyme
VPNLPLKADSLASGAMGGGDESCASVQILDLGSDLEQTASGTLAFAFRDNPINRAVIRANRARRMRVNAFGMTASLVASRRFSFRKVLCEEPAHAPEVAEGGISGGLIALDPGGYPAALPPVSVQLRCLWGQGFRIMQRWGQLYRQLDACHPTEPHCYLSLLAVHPARQGRGFGRRLLDTWLADVDARKMPGYLETDRKELVAFYQSAGFEVERELEAFGTTVWCMSRAARV